MSTRAVIARTTNESGTQWEGRYHHFDGYPSGLGKRLYELAQHFDDLAWMLAFLIDEHPAGWSNILNCAIDATPGYREFDSQLPEEPDRHDVVAHMLWERTQGPLCYCHGSRHWPAELFTSHGDAQDTEWCYAIQAASGVMTVYKRMDGRGRAQQWERVATVDLLSAVEPDWLLIEGRARIAQGVVPLRMTLHKTVGCYGHDQWDRNWATWSGPAVACALCEATITRGWTLALSDTHVCSAHVETCPPVA